MNSLRAVEAYRDAKLMLIVVEAVKQRHMRSDWGYRFQGSMKPVAVVVCAADETYTLGIEHELSHLGSLLEDVPELRAMVASFRST
jgi:hypothetical protein